MTKTLKPRAVVSGSRIALISPASSANATAIGRGLRELARLGFETHRLAKSERPEGYFSGSLRGRSGELLTALLGTRNRAVFCVRGGYGSAYLVDSLDKLRGAPPKVLLGYSDITCLQLALWRKYRWAGFYGPMVAAGFAKGARRRGGYDPVSLKRALTSHAGGWSIPLGGRTLSKGIASGMLLGGCLTLIENSLGTNWELDTRGSILLLEDRGVLPYQIDRTIVHLLQAGKFNGVRGILLGEFPDCEPAAGSRVSAREVCSHVLRPLGIPVVYGAPVGHARRPMLTIPLGVRARLSAYGQGRLDILEPAVTP